MLPHTADHESAVPRFRRWVWVPFALGACAIAPSCFVAIGDHRTASGDAGPSGDAADDISSDSPLDTGSDASTDSPNDATPDTSNDATSDAPAEAGSPQPLGRACKSSKWSGSAGVNRKRVNRFVQLEQQAFDRMLVYARNTGADAGSQSLRGVVYSAAPTTSEPNMLVAQSNDLTMNAGQTEGWVELEFDPPVSLAPGEYWIGFHSSAPSSFVYHIDTVTGVARINTDDYADGASTTFGTTETLDLIMSVYLRPVGVSVDHDQPCAVPP